MENKLAHYFKNHSDSLQIPYKIESEISSALKKSKHTAISVYKASKQPNSTISSAKAEETQKLKEIQARASQYRKDQLRREERRNKERVKLEEALAAEAAEKAKLEESRTIFKEQERQKRLKELEEKSSRRKEKSSSLRPFISQGPKEKPLYKRIEEDYKKLVEIPELSRRKQELAKKRELFSSVSQQELAEHQRLLRIQRQQIHLSKPQKSTKDRKFKEYLQKEKEFLFQKGENKRQKIELISRKKEYGDLIKKTHKPVIDPLKQKEMEVLIMKLQHPVELKIPKTSKPNYLGAISKSKSNSILFADKQSAPADKTYNSTDKMIYDKRDPYLEKRRLIRKKLEDDLLKHRNAEIETADNIEMQIRRKEGLLKYLHLNDPFNLNGIRAEAEVNDMVLQSVKSKIEKLPPFNS